MRPKIYLFGDSITEESFRDGGWGASLANLISGTVDVVLRGYSGYNSRWALKVLFPAAESGGSDGASPPPLAGAMDFGLVGQAAIVAGKWACEYPKSKEIEPDKAWEGSSEEAECGRLKPGKANS
ncbi:Uncharacterized protein TCM_043336 [Theobroma cacao]|uniref:GDSL esterase/lipase n=1 Tax=Theobroma cacao TaxID=3641 RepID=A0A061FPL6_THECC|nr:Uncharacterized protein TCM_043336 [Theobroma cacao]